MVLAIPAHLEACNLGLLMEVIWMRRLISTWLGMYWVQNRFVVATHFEHWSAMHRGKESRPHRCLPFLVPSRGAAFCSEDVRLIQFLFGVCEIEGKFSETAMGGLPASP